MNISKSKILFAFLFYLTLSINSLYAQNLAIQLSLTVEVELQTFGSEDEEVILNRIERKIQAYFKGKDRVTLTGNDLDVNNSFLGLKMIISKPPDSNYFIFTYIDYVNTDLDRRPDSSHNVWIWRGDITVINSEIDLGIESFLDTYYQMRLSPYLE